MTLLFRPLSMCNKRTPIYSEARIWKPGKPKIHYLKWFTISDPNYAQWEIYAVRHENVTIDDLYSKNTLIGRIYFLKVIFNEYC